MRPCSQTWHKATAVGDTTKAYFKSRCALELLGCMVDDQIPRNTVTFSSVISACEGAWTVARDGQVFLHVLSKGVWCTVSRCWTQFDPIYSHRFF